MHFDEWRKSITCLWLVSTINQPWLLSLLFTSSICSATVRRGTQLPNRIRYANSCRLSCSDWRCNYGNNRSRFNAFHECVKIDHNRHGAMFISYQLKVLLFSLLLRSIFLFILFNIVPCYFIISSLHIFTFFFLFFRIFPVICSFLSLYSFGSCFFSNLLNSVFLHLSMFKRDEAPRWTSGRAAVL